MYVGVPLHTHSIHVVHIVQTCNRGVQVHSNNKGKMTDLYWGLFFCSYDNPGPVHVCSFLLHTKASTKPPSPAKGPNYCAFHPKETAPET